MASLANAGYTPGSALADLGMRTTNPRVRAAAQAMARETAAGGSLAATMARQTAVFPPHVVGLVQAGETGGFLPFAFEEAALGAEQDAALRQNLWVVKLLTWQSVWSVLLAAPLFLNFGRLFSETNGGVAALGHIVRMILFVAVPVGLLLHGLALLAGWLWRQPGMASLRDRLTLAVPAMARLARMRALASFTRVLRRLLMSGISPAPAFVGASQAVPNGILRDRFLDGAAVVGSGGGLDEAIRATGLMGDDPMNLLITGQKTGQWSEMLEQVTAYYQEEAARATEAAKSAQKRWATMTVIVSMGYVTCALAYYGYKAMFKFVDGFGG
jgi:type II secretory pathway component PulF